jgi:hypothetical protein
VCIGRRRRTLEDLSVKVESMDGLSVRDGELWGRAEERVDRDDVGSELSILWLKKSESIRSELKEGEGLNGTNSLSNLPAQYQPCPMENRLTVLKRMAKTEMVGKTRLSFARLLSFSILVNLQRRREAKSARQSREKGNTRSDVPSPAV